MTRGFKFVLPAVIAGAALLATPLLAQVQSQPLPPPSGTPQVPQTTTTPAVPPSAPAPSTPAPTVKTDPPKAPTAGTKPAAKPTQASNACPEEKIDINSATTDTLKKLPQIGVQRSNAIVRARPYTVPEDLLKKKVLKKAAYDKIKSCITASGVAASVTPAAAKGSAPAAKPSAPASPVPLPAPAPASKRAQ